MNGIDKLLVEASDGKTATYSFNSYQYLKPPVEGLESPPPKKQEPQSRKYCLVKAKYSHKPQINYDYDHSENEDPVLPPANPLLKKKSLPNNRFQEVTYYKEGKNEFQNSDNVKNLKKSDFRINRVKEIFAPASNSDPAPVMIYSFEYHADDITKANHNRSFSGYTKVVDANKHQTQYAYNSEHRPILISHFTDLETPYSKTHFIWDEGSSNDEGYKLVQDLLKAARKSKQENIIDTTEIEPHTKLVEIKNTSVKTDQAKVEVPHLDICKKILALKESKEKHKIGNLLGKYLEDGNGKIENGLFFDYDSRGNIIQECFYGNLTGTKDMPLSFKQPSKWESYSKCFTFSDDGYNHLLTEKEDNGKKIKYVYDPVTQQIAAKYIKNDNQIIFRQFFFYDEQTASLVKVVKDDGSSKDFDNLEDVEERLITEITLTEKDLINPKNPIGLPKIIEEKYWDKNKEEAILLKKMECHYTDGNLTSQDHYDAENNLCYSLSWEFDAHGNVIKETNALGHFIIKNYDENDNLICEEGPRTGDSKKFKYDYVDRLIEIEHCTRDKIFLAKFEYDFMGNRTASIDSLGNKTEYTYDELNRLIKTTYPSMILEDTSTVQPVSEIHYDINNNPISINQPGGWETKFTYNSREKPITKTYPDGRIEKFEYYLDGTLAKTKTPNGAETTYTRDFLGRIVEEITFDGKEEIKKSYTYKGSHLQSIIDGEGTLTTYTYDEAGRLSSESSGSIKKSYCYDTLGRIEKIYQWYGDAPEQAIIQAFKYDFLNRVIEEKLEDAHEKIIQQSRYQYDEMGNKTQTSLTTDDGEKLTTFEFDGNGQPLIITDAEGNQTHYVYHYNKKNELKQCVLHVEITDPKGRITNQTYDALGRVQQIICTEPFTQKILSHKEIFYDQLGRTIKTIDKVIVDGKSQRDYVNKWRYYSNEQEEELIEEGVGSGLSKRTEWKYNSFGQKEVLIKPDGKKITHRYDLLGRLEEIFSNDGSIHYQYNYDKCHRAIKVEDKANHTTTLRNYDQNGSLIEETLGNELNFKYGYDPLARLTNFTLPDGSAINYHYESAYLKEIERNKNGKAVYQHQNVTFDLSGALKKAILIDKAGSLDRTYDNLGRIQEIKTKHWSQIIPKDGFDKTGCLLATTTQDPLSSIDHTFSYNDLDHLKTENGHGSHHYVTDSLQNRLKKNDLQCQVNALNQLTKQGDSSYTYDKNGNLIEKNENQEKIVYEYDALDRLISITSSKGTTTYQYDPFHRRLSKTHQGITSRFLYQQQNEIGSVNEEGEIIELRILGGEAESELGTSIALELYGKTYAPVHDRQDHIICLLDSATGQPVETYRYTAFGEESIFNEQGEKVANSPVGNPWRFSSKRIDPETGWIFFGRRYYDPEIGRWTTSDPIGFGDGPNLYAYLHHNPLMGFDAYGLRGEGYRDSCNVGSNSPFYDRTSDHFEPMFSMGPDHQSADEQRSSYISEMYNQYNNSVAGSLHGGVDYLAKQVCGFASFFCTIGSSEWDDPDERQMATHSFAQSQLKHLNQLDLFVTSCIGVDPNHPTYNSARFYTATGLDIATFVIPCCSIIRGGMKAMQVSSTVINAEKIAGGLAGSEIKYALTSGAENVNAGVNLGKKLSQLETAQQTAVNIRFLSDGRIRYYGKETLSATAGPTRGRSYVTEYNTNNQGVRTWMECYDHYGNINRVHPKQINGQTVLSPHYPPTLRELGL